jgi:hypothetical protein
VRDQLHRISLGIKHLRCLLFHKVKEWFGPSSVLRGVVRKCPNPIKQNHGALNSATPANFPQGFATDGIARKSASAPTSHPQSHKGRRRRRQPCIGVKKYDSRERAPCNCTRYHGGALRCPHVRQAAIQSARPPAVATSKRVQASSIGLRRYGYIKLRRTTGDGVAHEQRRLGPALLEPWASNHQRGGPDIAPADSPGWYRMLTE